MEAHTVFTSICATASAAAVAASSMGRTLTFFACTEVSAEDSCIRARRAPRAPPRLSVSLRTGPPLRAPDGHAAFSRCARGVSSRHAAFGRRARRLVVTHGTNMVVIGWLVSIGALRTSGCRVSAPPSSHSTHDPLCPGV
eukprot:1188303-Prorocentrum_minimum.AAC.2